MDDVVVVAILGVAVVATLAVVLLNCVCFDDGKKGASTGRDDNLNNNRGVPKDDVGNSGHDGVDGAADTGPSSKRNTTQRELPKIPFEDINLGDLYATVDEVTQFNQIANGGLSYSSDLSHPVTSNGHPAQPDRSPDAGGPPELWPAHSTKHAYDQLRNQISEDRDTDTDDDPAAIYSTPDNAGNRSSRIGGASFDAGPPPIPDKHFGPGESSTSSAAGGYHSSATASAIAGRSSAGSIPFMTSPLATSQELVYADDQAEPGLHPRYSSISVREPIRELLRATGSSPSRDPVPDAESTYWNVQDDEMYAEIQSAQNSANSSVTYSKIDPPTILEPPGPVPPAPPTVESLRSVAHSQAHSRNASSSSFTSDTDYPHSPISERSCGSFANAGATAGPAILDVSELYSTVDKSKKTRASIHVMEASSAATGGPSLDDLYAKVHKGNSLSVNRHPLAQPAASTGARPKLHNFAPVVLRHDNSSPRDSSSSTSSKMQTVDEPRGSTGVRSSATPSLLRRNSSTEDPRYEKITDRSLAADNADDDVSEVGYETVKISAGSSASAAASSSKVAGYETIRGDADNYEEIVEPNYEMVKNPRRHRGEVDDDPGVDPGYERIVNGPNYETVRYDQQHPTRGHHEEGVDTVTVEPRYWLIDNRRRLAGRPDDADDPFYERISGRDEDLVDPNYEKVKTGSELSSESSEPGYESVKKPISGVSQEDGYAKVREAVGSAKNHGYEKLNKVGGSGSGGGAASHTDSGPRLPTMRSGEVTGHSERVYAEPSMATAVPPNVAVGPVAAAGDSGVAASPRGPVDQNYRQGKVLENSFQDDVLL